ncbi:MAG TPA: FkbM family methyltransferase [Gemmatimonadales bacterium]|nr:FkbM family methyltransferase [Gemmatimonadales bacterium]
MKWIIGSSNHGCWLGTYELEKQRALERVLQRGMVVYDIGAQAGFYALFFTGLVGEKGKVYAVEPFAENIYYLVAHVRLNKLENVEVIQAALCEGAGLHNFTIDLGVSQNRLTDDGETVLRVPTLSVDDLWGRCGCAPPDLIKIDVEGAEARILQGAKRTLERYRPILFVALHGDQQRHACRQILEDLEYRVCDLAGRTLSGQWLADEISAWSTGRQGGECFTSGAGR